MLKKILIVSLLAVSLLLTTPKQEVEGAEFPFDITWSTHDYGSGYYGLRGIVYIPAGTVAIEIWIPNSAEHLVENTPADRAELIFENCNTGTEDIDIANFFGNGIYDQFIPQYIDFDFEAYDSQEADLSSCEILNIYIPQASDPTSRLTDIDDNDDIVFWDDIPDYRDIYFMHFPSVDSYNFMTPIYETPLGAKSMTIDMGGFSQWNPNISSYKSKVRIYDGITIIGQYELEDYLTEGTSGYYIIPLDEEDYTEMTHYQLYFYWNAPNMNFINSVNRAGIIEWDADIQAVYFFNQLSLYDTEIIITGDIPSLPTEPTPATGFEFLGWFDKNGREYTFGTPFPDDLQDDAIVRLFARYIPTDALTEWETDDPTPDTNHLYNFLVGVGLDSDMALTIFYILSLVAVFILCFKLKVGAFVSLLVGLILTAGFIYFGLIPIIVSSIGLLALITMLIVSWQRGGVHS